jgi:phosphoribosylformylglycinamidine synthase
MTLMDLASIITKKLKKQKLVKDLDESEEINACSIVVPIKVDGKKENWLVMFKNETHNHPTEIEPFRRRCYLSGGRYQGSSQRPQLCVSGHADHRCGRPPGGH